MYLEFESGTAEVNSDGEETVKSSIAGSSVASTRRTANDDYSLSDGTQVRLLKRMYSCAIGWFSRSTYFIFFCVCSNINQTTVVSSVARLPAQRMTKIRRLLGLVEHRVGHSCCVLALTSVLTNKPN